MLNLPLFLPLPVSIFFVIVDALGVCYLCQVRGKQFVK